METVENVESYHEVFAKSLGVIVEKIGNATDTPNDNSMKQAERLLHYNIIYAYTMYRTQDEKVTAGQIFKEIEGLGLGKLGWKELSVTMAFYQSKAGLKPVQSYTERAKVFDRVRKRLR